MISLSRSSILSRSERATLDQSPRGARSLSSLAERGATLTFAQAFQELDQGEEQGDDDEADDAAQDDDHDRFKQADEAFHQRIDFFVVEVGDLVEHGVE